MLQCEVITVSLWLVFIAESCFFSCNSYIFASHTPLKVGGAGPFLWDNPASLNRFHCHSDLLVKKCHSIMSNILLNKYCKIKYCHRPKKNNKSKLSTLNNWEIIPTKVPRITDSISQYFKLKKVVFLNRNRTADFSKNSRFAKTTIFILNYWLMESVILCTSV